MALLHALLIYLSSPAFADLPAECSDLAKQTCSPTSYQDPTGRTKSPSQLEQDKAAMWKKLDPGLKQDVKSLLAASPEALATASAALGIDPSLVPDKVAQMVLHEVGGPGNVTPSDDSYKNLQLVRKLPAYRSAVDRLRAGIVREAVTNKSRTTVKDKVFPKVLALFIEKIKAQPMDPKVKQKLLNRISNIHFTGTSCSSFNSAFRISDGYLTSNAHYQAEDNGFEYCDGLLANSDSEFQMAFIIGHELSHAIDPCLIAKPAGDAGPILSYPSAQNLTSMQMQHPWGDTLACLRSPGSAGALNEDALDREKFAAKKAYCAEYQHYPNYDETCDETSTNHYANRIANPRNIYFCERDQITESFADWMGTELLADYIGSNYKFDPAQSRAGYANAFRNKIGCAAQSPNEFLPGIGNVHPESKLRINHVIAQHPRIRLQMGCPVLAADGKYCEPTRLVESPAKPAEAPPIGEEETTR